MSERRRTSEYLKKLQKQYPSAFIYKIPDSPVGRKPFDAMFFYKGVFEVIEFKMEGEELRAHQKKFLEIVARNGGISKVIYFKKGGGIEEVLF